MIGELILNVCGAIFAGLYFGGLLLVIRHVRRQGRGDEDADG